MAVVVAIDERKSGKKKPPRGWLQSLKLGPMDSHTLHLVDRPRSSSSGCGEAATTRSKNVGEKRRLLGFASQSVNRVHFVRADAGHPFLGLTVHSPNFRRTRHLWIDL
jgi:hypothetical protein